MESRPYGYSQISLRNKEEPVEEENNFTDISFLELYKFSSCWEKLLLLFGSLLCCVCGIATTIFAYITGVAVGGIVDYVHEISIVSNETISLQEKSQIMDQINYFSILLTVTAIVLFIGTYLATVLFNYTALKQVFKIRQLYFRSILNQDVSWYDQNKTGDFANNMADDLQKVQEGIGEKMSIFIYHVAVSLSSTIQAFVFGWKLTLICCSTYLVSIFTMSLFAKVIAKYTKNELDICGKASNVAEEALSSIKTVVAYDGQKLENDRYNKLLLQALKNNIKLSFYNSLNYAFMIFFVLFTYAVGFWFGITLIIQGRENSSQDTNYYTTSSVFTIFNSVATATMFMGNIAPFAESINIARVAASKIFHIISTKSTINQSYGKGLKLDEITKIEFKNVHFSYPSRPQARILDGLNFCIHSGQTVALVGSSGCGKSTCIQLLDRFYDPTHGNILINDAELSKFDLHWWRSQVGLVEQEPKLFEGTIAENIKMGCSDVSQSDVEEAAIKANAHSFIMAFPKGFQTLIGELGSQVSGGQKQRIAIARALIRKPNILLLDEATSSLDSQSESIVQATLEKAAESCTVIVVAHRLSTIKKADKIIVISNGKVVEEGSHDALMLAKGVYEKLVKTDVAKNSKLEERAVEPTVEKNFGDHHEEIKEYKKTSPINDTPEDEEQISPSFKDYSMFWNIMKFNSSEKWYILFGCLGALLTGATFPLYAVIFKNTTTAISEIDIETVLYEAKINALYMLYLSFGAAIALFLQDHMFGIAGQKFITKLRGAMFQNMLNQEMGWFDLPENGCGSLIVRLSDEVANIQGTIGHKFGILLSTISAIICAVVVNLILEYRIGVLSLCLGPILFIGLYYEKNIFEIESESRYVSLQQAIKLAMEAINNIRTVASLCMEEEILKKYVETFLPHQKLAQRNCHVRGLVYGFGRSVLLLGYAVCYYYGGYLIKDDYSTSFCVLATLECFIVTSWSISQSMAFFPNFQSGLNSASRILKLINRVSSIKNNEKEEGGTLTHHNIEYKNLHFSYPTRPEITVVNNLNLLVLKGKTVALVGASGCGKSTIVQLLERFYDPTSGQIIFCDKDVSCMNLSNLRLRLGIVSQEPNLFSRTVGENIAYGNNTKVVSTGQIIEAAKKANVHNFITSLPLGYDTKLGRRGTQLSGGQKQRIAIARALIRNPEVLLLDEATSSLDAENEKVVQEALDAAKDKRTCIVIAHRLQTIENADLIVVINKGKIVEMGNHSSLMNQKKIYWNLQNV